MNIRGYLRWQFEGTLTSPSFYGFSLCVLAVVALIAGCPLPWPQIMTAVGLITVFVDAARSWFRFSYSIYEMERQNTERELKRKDR